MIFLWYWFVCQFLELSFSSRSMFSLSRAFNNSIRNKVIVETEIAGLRGAVGQYNVIQTSPYKSVAPMHKSAYVVECPPQLERLTLIRIAILARKSWGKYQHWFGSCSVIFHADRFHWNDHNPCIFVLKGIKLRIKRVQSKCNIMNHLLTLLAQVLLRNIGHQLFLEGHHALIKQTMYFHSC